MFEHSEYHIYTTNDRLEKSYVHLDERMLSEARDLHEDELDVSNDWETIHRLEVGDNIHLTVGSGSRFGPRLESRGYEGWTPVSDGDLEDRVFFDTMLFNKCIGKNGRQPDWSFAEVKEWVNYEHRDQFEGEFDEYLAGYKDNPRREDLVVDW